MKNQNNSGKYIIKDKIRDLCYENIYGTGLSGRVYLQAQKTVKKDYSAFSDYIFNAKNAAVKRDSASADFFRIDNQTELFLSKWYEIEIISKIIKAKIESDTNAIKILTSYGFEVLDINPTSIKNNGQEIEYTFYDNKIFFTCDNLGDITINSEKEILFDIKEYRPEFIEYNGKNINVKNGKVYLDNYNGELCNDINIDFIKFKLTKGNSSKKDNVTTIELQDDESLDVSVFDTFFNEDVQEVYFNNNSKVKFKIKNKLKEFGQLEIYDKRRDIPVNGTVSISTNTYQLKCQSRAIDILVNSPSQYHKALLYLSDDKDLAQLDYFGRVKEMEIDFKILTRLDLKGNANQRSFVNKALQTPDFMILEGPPGSGKTTALLEFIYQAIKQGKKVMLSASTHVAVDNVLEKLLSHPDSKELLKYINPVRIGSEDNIYVDDVKKFTYENIMSTIPTDCQQMVEESFNLVCGTTIGILQYPYFKNKLGNNQNIQGTIEPIFDYLIIDEASKTTFNEFLVPAIFAKKWIIVGDVKQLAPYVEKNDLVPTLINSQVLRDKSIREAIYFLMMISKMKKTELYNKAFLMSGSTIKYLDEYLDKENYILVTSLKTNNLFTISLDDIKEESYKLCSLDSSNRTVLIDESIAKQVIPLLNTKILVIGKSKNISRGLYFDEFQILHYRFKDFYKESMELDDRYSKRLEDEILWRLIRMYELAHSDNFATVNYEKYIEEVKKYISKDRINDYNKIISMISEIALPSIIASLQQGIKKQSFDVKNTILNSGFSSSDKLNRFESLEFQYRMHEDISRLPRELVYNNQALKDDKRTYPEFKYFKQESRFTVIDVNGANVTRNQNEKEATVIIENLIRISNYAKAQNLKYEIAILSFYNGQVTLLRKKLQKYFNSNAKYNFSNGNLKVTLNTVDKFQGQEAQIVFISMVQNKRVGFMDSINRVNVAITRAKEKLIIVGDKQFFSKKQSNSTLLKNLFKEEVSNENRN